MMLKSGLSKLYNHNNAWHFKLFKVRLHIASWAVTSNKSLLWAGAEVQRKLSCVFSPLPFALYPCHYYHYCACLWVSLGVWGLGIVLKEKNRPLGFSLNNKHTFSFVENPVCGITCFLLSEFKKRERERKRNDCYWLKTEWGESISFCDILLGSSQQPFPSVKLCPAKCHFFYNPQITVLIKIYKNHPTAWGSDIPSLREPTRKKTKKIPSQRSLAKNASNPGWGWSPGSRDTCWWLPLVLWRSAPTSVPWTCPYWFFWLCSCFHQGPWVRNSLMSFLEPQFITSAFKKGNEQMMDDGRSVLWFLPLLCSGSSGGGGDSSP